MSIPRVEAKPGQYLTFSLKEQTFGVPISAVREINRVCEITRIPQMPTYMVGVINLRGKVIPVVDLRLKLSMPISEHTRETCIVVVDGTHGQTGVIVDAVKEVVTLNGNQLEMPPSLAAKQHTFVMGMGKTEAGIIVLVDVLNLLSREEILEYTEPEKAAA